jgi:hypothetical protein
MNCTLVEKARKWPISWPEEIPPGLLKKGLQISVPPDPSSQGEDENPTDRLYKVHDWSLALRGEGETELLIEVREIRSYQRVSRKSVLSPAGAKSE